jgi:uncharacterized membrane protein
VVFTVKASALELETVSVRVYSPVAVLLPEYVQVVPVALGKYWLEHMVAGVGAAWSTAGVDGATDWPGDTCRSGKLQADKARIASMSTATVTIDFLSIFIS